MSPTASSDRLLLFAKIPEPGRVKTRLCPPLDAGEAAGLYEGFLRDVLEQSLRLRRQGVEVELHYCGGEEADLPPWVRRFEDLRCRGQEGEGLGARMRSAFERAFSEGARRVVLRNTDSPLLAEEHVLEAFRSLGAPGVDLVLGPDLGGGYYLVGLTRLLEGLFELESLGSHSQAETVLERTRIRALDQGHTVCLLPEAGDVDLPSDLEALLRRGPSELKRAPHTARMLDRIRP